MAIDYLVPKLGMAMNEGTISKWLVADGDLVKENQVILELETDKVSSEVESPATGYFSIVGVEGETYKVDALIARIFETKEELEAHQSGQGGSDSSARAGAAAVVRSEESDDMPKGGTLALMNREPATVETVLESRPRAPAPTAVAPSRVPSNGTTSRIVASPLAKRIATKNNFDITTLKGKGTGPKGRIIRQDVVAALNAPAKTGSSLVRYAGGHPNEKARIPITGMRKSIATNMMDSLATTAQLSSVWESDVTELLAMHRKYVAREDKFGTRVSVNAFLLKAIAYGTSLIPIANSCRDGDEIVIYDGVNIGIAIALPGMTEYDKSLMVPVLKNVDQMGIVDIDFAMKSLVSKARNGELQADDMAGSTITMTSTAGIAPPGCQSTPILNKPNAVIVNPSTPMEKPVVRDGQIVARTMMPMSITFDHCILDGELAVRFASAIHECLENPELLLA